MSWTIFGSVITSDEGVTQGHPHYGRACQRNGVTYRWVFHKGSYLVAVYQDGYRVREHQVKGC